MYAFVVYIGLFTGRKISENKIGAHAARLVTNCILAYNAMILNAVLKNAGRLNIRKTLNEFAKTSPIASQNLFLPAVQFKKQAKLSLMLRPWLKCWKGTLSKCSRPIKTQIHHS